MRTATSLLALFFVAALPACSSSSPSKFGATHAVTLTLQGEWSAAAAYTPGAIVSYRGGSFVARNDVTGTPPLDASNAVAPDWQVISMPPQVGPAGPGLAPRGAWSAMTSYQAGDLVSFMGSSFAAIAPNVGVAPPDPVKASANASWMVLSAAGIAGKDGKDAPPDQFEHLFGLDAQGNRIDLGRFAGGTSSFYTATVNGVAQTRIVDWAKSVSVLHSDGSCGASGSDEEYLAGSAYDLTNEQWYVTETGLLVEAANALESIVVRSESIHPITSIPTGCVTAGLPSQPYPVRKFVVIGSGMVQSPGNFRIGLVP